MKTNSPTNAHQFSSRDLMDLTGLSYRQIAEWDNRDAMPNQRVGERGWRRVTLSQAISLGIVVGIKKSFGTPVTTLKALLSWMQGEVLTTDGLTARRRAEDHLVQFTAEEIEASNASLKTRIDTGRAKITEVSADATLPVGGSDAKPEAEAAFIARAVTMTVPRLVSRGWQDAKAREFCKIFFTMSGATFAPERVLNEFVRLSSLADEARDRIARQATQMLCSGLSPIVGVLGAMSAGMPMYLVTDLKTSRFLDEFALTEFAKAGLLRGDYLYVYVNDFVNEVLQRAGKKPMVLRFAPADASNDAEPKLSGREKELIALLREGDFKRATVTPKGERYHVEIEKTSAATEVAKIIEMIEKRGYHSVVVKKHNDEISYVMESESRMLG